MTEIKLLDATLELIDDTGTTKAYEYLVSHLNKEDEWSSQVYNFLYCLAATSDKTDEAIQWLNEAIMDKGLWYRPEVFEDDDLDVIRDAEEFISCVEVSTKRYEEALKNAKTVFSWEKKKEDNLFLVLHGNQQNNYISRSFWSEFDMSSYQIEYLQSSEIDSYQLYRWSDDGDGPTQLANVIESIKGVQYNKTVLAAFSAGCNTILRAITTEGFKCDKIVLFSPWMPVIDEMSVEVIEALKVNDIEAILICGELDEDCIPQCELFESKAQELGFNYKIKYLKDTFHEYPEELTTMIR